MAVDRRQREIGGRRDRLVLCAGVVAVIAALVAAGADAGARQVDGCGPSIRGCVANPVPSLEPKATAALWQRLVLHPRPVRNQAACRPLRGVFYAATDWLRVATKLAATASPCADYYISIPPFAADKTAIRPDQAWRIRALGPNFHALAEIHWTGWSRWIASTGYSWYDAGVEARRRMADAGFDVAAGDTWAINEFPSTVRTGVGSARANARDLVRGLYGADGQGPARGVVFIIGVGQGTSPVSVYQAQIQNWLADTAFWADMSKYVSDWSQEVYGDIRMYGIPGAPPSLRRDYLNDYLQHVLVIARAGPTAVESAREYLQSAHSPLANAAWQWESGYGWTMTPLEEMQAFVSAQVYAARAFSAAVGQPQDHWGFAWQPDNSTAIAPADFTRKTAAILDRLAMAIRDSDRASDPSNAGSEACGPAGQNVYCATDLDGAQFTELWKSFQAWSEPILSFSTPSQTITAGTTSSPMNLTLTSGSGSAQVAPTPISATLTSSSEQGEFSPTPEGPWTRTLAVTIPAGSSSAPPFSYRDTRAALPQLSASARGATPATQLEKVVPGSPVSLRVDPTSAALEPGWSHMFGLAAVDAFGNLNSVQATWSVTPTGLGTVAPATGSIATFTAGARRGTGRLIATVAAASGEISASASVKVSPGAIRIASVRYEPRARIVLVTATVVDVGGEAVRGAVTSVVVRRNGRWYFAARKRTDTNGRTTYIVNLKPGCYRTTVTTVTASGYRWDGRTPVNGFCR
jgi:hypothetical protein